MWLHTASSGGDGENDANYCTFGDEDAPLTNLVIGNTGIVWVCAGGATNTNGKGYAFNVSKGQIPNDSANSYAVGIEISNNGVGGPYPQSQIDSCFTASLTLTNRLGLAPDDVQSHNGYAPDRKVDPATATAVEGPWQPRSVTSSGSWDVEDLKAECRKRAAGGSGSVTPEPVPITVPINLLAGAEDDPMFITKNGNNIFFIGNGLVYRQVFGDEIDSMFTGYNGKLIDWKSGKTVTGKNGVGVTKVVGLGVRIGKGAESDTT
jgi:hypothetical protein